MLLELYIENFALIDKVRLNFENGFNILTGETGSGKSIIIDALNLCLGERYDKSFIRRGNKRGLVEAIFNTDNKDIESKLLEYGIDISDDYNVTISRDIFSDGKSISKINGRSVRLTFLKEISSMLIDIHSQHENSAFLKKENHIKFLDLYGQEDIKNVKQDYEMEYEKYIGLKKQLMTLNENKDEMQIQREIDLIKFQIEEIETADLKEHEYEILLKQREVHRNIEKIYSGVNESYFSLYENDENAYNLISKAIKSLKDIYVLDEKIDIFYNDLQEILYKIQDISIDMRNYKENIDFSSKQLDDVEIRIDIINNLKRKYGATIADILNYSQTIKERLDDILNRDEKVKTLKENIQKIEKILQIKSNNLTEVRKIVSKRLQMYMCEELSSLNMKNIKFEVNFKESNNFYKTGKDIIEFMVSFNLGEELKPIYKIASGGEMSRFMLAFKSILSDVDNIQTLIFDEIDTGISGITAQIVGEKIKEISKRKQILCITHLPQIAANSNFHYYIEKIASDGRTYVKIEKLTQDEKINEIARLIGGLNITPKTIEHAKEIIKLAQN